MNIGNVLQRSVIFVVLLAAFFGMPIREVSASTNATMSQKILPVRFVYLEKNGSIDHIWSNVTEKDDEYVVKFFDKKKKEVKKTESLLGAYQINISKDDKKTIKLDRSIHFNKKGDSLEEVYTII